MEKIKTIKELKKLLSEKVNDCNFYTKKFDSSNMSHSSVSSQGMSTAYDYVLDLLIESNELIDANTFINLLDNNTINKIRKSQSDAQVRRILKELLKN